MNKCPQQFHKGCITIMSRLAVANPFVCRIRWAGSFVHGSRRTVCNALV